MRLINQVHNFALNVDLDEYLAAGIGSLHDDNEVAVGNDRIYGGQARGNARPDEGVDTIVGDNGVITPLIIGEPYDEKLYEEQALAFHLLLRDLEHVAADTALFLADQNEAVRSALGANIGLINDLHSLSRGNDFVDPQPASPANLNPCRNRRLRRRRVRGRPQRPPGAR